MRVRYLLVLSLISTWASAQVGNEWINLNQRYYRVPIGKDGIYRVTRSDLASAGVPVSQLDPRKLQLFFRGQEQAIHVVHQQSPADGVFDTGEYLEFYGKRNDGTLDTELYANPANQPHTFYNLYNDTTYYFLTEHATLQGKRMATFSQVNNDALPVEFSHTANQRILFTNSYSAGQTYNSLVQLTAYDAGEGWTGSVIRENNTADAVITGVVDKATTAGVPSIAVQLMGRGQVGHLAEIYIGASDASLRLLTTVNFSGYLPHTYSTNVLWSDISAAGTSVIRVRVLGTGGADFVSISYASLSYPRTFNMGGATEHLFQLQENAGNKSYIEISNAPAQTRLFDITDPANPVVIGTTQTATLNAVVNNTALARQVLATSLPSTPTGIKPVSFRSLSGPGEFVIITHRNFQKPALGSSNPVQSYAAYRASVAGGGYDTLTVTIDQLYNQFSYGERTPLAIYRFLKYRESIQRPDYLFLIGKGLNPQLGYYRNPGAFGEAKDYVPTAGFPSSDMYYSAALSEVANVPAISTGRLSVTRPEQVIYYLDKVTKQESQGFTDLARKRILHLSGGIAAGEPETFKSYMEDFASVAEDFYLGGSVAAIAKRSLASQELINISEEVNNGLGLICFFGHSSTSTTDFDIGFATDPVLGYDNDRYPMLLINGCNAGAFFGQNTLFGEDWVNASERGAVGFIAHSYFGFVSTLKRYTDHFYRVAYGDANFLRKGVGDVQRETALRYLGTSFNTAQNITQVQQMVLLGDPAVKLFGAENPDYQIDQPAVSLRAPDGGIITSTTPVIEVRVVVKNFGSAENTPLRVRVRRTLPDNSIQEYDSLFNPVLFQDTLTIRVVNEPLQAGDNSFSVTLDPNAAIEELNEDNNAVAVELFIPLGGSRNLYPSKFAIVNSMQPELIFQSANLLDSVRSFVIEVDTAYTFDSPWKKHQILEADVLGRFALDLLANDSLTYYWRTRLAFAGSSENGEWDESSFTYIQNGVPGWTQMAFPQVLPNLTEGVVVDVASRSTRYDELTTPVLIKTYGDLNTASSLDVSVKIDGVEYNLATQGQPCRDHTINLIAFHKSTNVPYPAVPFNFQDPRTCGREPQVIVSFTTAEIFNNGAADLIQAINDLPSGDSVVLFTIGNPLLSTWDAAVVSKLAEVGIDAAQLAAIGDGEPFVIFARKGSSAGTASIFESEIDPPAEQELVVNKQVTARVAEGSMTSVTIGPALQWKQLYFNTRTDASDDIQYKVWGVTPFGQETLLIADAGTGHDLSTVSATEYPQLKLELSMRDEVELTPAQLDYWLVTYDPYPEGMLFFAPGTSDSPIVEEGELVATNFGFITLSEPEFTDSLVVRYTNVNQLTNTSEEKEVKIKPASVGDTTRFQLTINTLEKPGLNDLQVFVNPRLQPEQYFDNNVLMLKDVYTALVDETNPVLRVSVDGRQLANGDYVSPNPTIQVELWDENELILKTDTSGIRMLLQCAMGCNPQEIYFTRPDVQWMPGTLSAPFTAIFRPQNLAAGDYTLQVFAEDSRGNQSGGVPYTITFVVDASQKFVLTGPFPNPSDPVLNFQIVFTTEVITGGWFEVIDPMGKLLFDEWISSDNWHVGTNYFTVDLGTTFPNGLYLYRIRMFDGTYQQGQFLINR